MIKVQLKCNQQLLEKSYDILYNQIGVTEETGKNDGVIVESYLASIGLSKGNPYCAAGQYFCFSQACKDLAMDKKEIPVARTGLAVTMFKIAKKKGVEVPYSPSVHDLIVWVKPNGVNGHIERIVNIIDDDSVETIAFNTSNGKSGSQREGDGVFLRVRSITEKIGNMKVLGLIGFTYDNDRTDN